MPSSSKRCGSAGRLALPLNPRFCPTSLGGADGDGTPSLPFGRAGARPSLGFGPMAGTRCRSSPRNRVTKSHTRRCQRSILPSPSQFLSRECKESIPHSPAAFKREMRFLEVCRRIDPTQVAKTGQTCFRAFISSQWDCGRGRSSDGRGHAPPRWRLSMRRVRRPRPTGGRSKLYSNDYLKITVMPEGMTRNTSDVFVRTSFAFMPWPMSWLSVQSSTTRPVSVLPSTSG